MTPTEQDEETLEAIGTYIRDNGFPPSRRELMTLLNLGSPSSAQKRVERLVELGWITINKDQPRALRIVK